VEMGRRERRVGEEVMPEPQKPIGYDPASGRPVYGFDPNSGAPVFADSAQTQAAPPPFNPPRIAEKRGFLSAAKDMVSGLPSVSAAISNPTLAAYQAIKDAPAKKQDIIAGLKAHGIPAEIVHQVGMALGIPSHDLVKDYKDKNYSAFAGDIAAPLAAAAITHEGVKAVGDITPAASEGIRQRAVASTEGAVQAARNTQASSIMRAVPPTNTTPYSMETVNRARPYLEEEHAIKPIADIQSFVESSNNAIRKIESKVSGYVAANPNDVIGTNPLAAARAALAKNPRAGAIEAGLKEINDLGLDKPITLSRAEAIRSQMNAENKAFMDKNQYDRATARKADPAFAAREAVAESMRDGIYNRLETRGFKDARELRRDEGALIQLRDAGQKQFYAGEKSVPGTGANGIGRKIVSQGVKVGSTGVGAGLGGIVGGPAGAIGGGMAGSIIGEDLSKRISRPNMTRDALILKAFGGLK